MLVCLPNSPYAVIFKGSDFPQIRGFSVCSFRSEDRSAFYKKGASVSNTIYMKEGSVKVNYKPETGVIYVLWKDMFDQNIVRECCERQLREVRNGAKIIVVDVSTAKGVVLEETQKWFETYLFPGYAEAGLSALITIDSEIPVTQLSAKRWTQTGADFSFDVVMVRSRKEAEKAVAEYIAF